jgi:hypothetical protein
VNSTGWQRGLTVTGGGTGVVSHAGVALIRSLADNTGLTAGLSAALAGDRLLTHDRGRALADLACAIADGGYELTYSVGRELGERERAAIGLVPESAWQIAVDVRGEFRERRARDACADRQCTHRRCWGRGSPRHRADRDPEAGQGA